VKERAQLLRTYGRTPARPKYAFRVATTAIVIPQWARARTLAELTQSYDHVWLRSGILARRVAAMDRESGGNPTCDRMEIRRCKVCKRWLVGANAERRRMLDESAIDGRKLPCGPECLERRHL
jgi:hypothetical protein